MVILVSGLTYANAQSVRVTTANDWLFLYKVCAPSNKSLHQQYITVKTDKGKFVYNVGINLGMGQCGEYQLPVNYTNPKSIKITLEPKNLKMR